LTGGVKEANAGGTAGDTLGRLGIKAVVIEGQTEPGALYLLHIKNDTAELLPAGDVRGLGTYAASEKLQE
jgi:aldehyde:ferredoxin oxidoreductase